MTIERKRFFADTFSGNGNVVTLVAKATARKPNCHQHLHMQTETGFRIKSETGFDSLVKFHENLWPIKHFNKYFRKFRNQLKVSIYVCISY